MQTARENRIQLALDPHSHAGALSTGIVSRSGGALCACSCTSWRAHSPRENLCLNLIFCACSS